MIDNRGKIAIIILLVLALPVFAEFVQTLVVFSVDTSMSFTVFTLGGGNNNTKSKSYVPGNFTEAYYFNSTSRTKSWIVPCAGADSTNCQSSNTTPAFRIRNTGNVNISISMNISTALPATIKLCANSSRTDECSGIGTVTACDMSGTAGNLNATDWLNISSNIGQEAPCYEVNVTMYADFISTVAGTPVLRTLTMNSTAS